VCDLPWHERPSCLADLPLSCRAKTRIISASNSRISKRKRASEFIAPQVADLSTEDIAALATCFSGMPAKANRVSDEDPLPVGRCIYTWGNGWSGLPACANCRNTRVFLLRVGFFRHCYHFQFSRASMIRGQSTVNPMCGVSSQENS